MTPSPVKVLIADDQPVVLAGLQSMLDADADIEVVGGANDGMAAVELAASALPDVVLMDIRMPRLDGISATRRIIEARTATAVVMITTFDDEAYLLESIRAGASGFLLKDAGADLLVAAVHSAIRGDALIDPGMTRMLLERRLDALSRDERATRVYTPTLDSLTERERETLAALSRGLSNNQMACEFHLSEATIKTHVGNILNKVGARSRVEAVVFAYESGFVRPGSRPIGGTASPDGSW